MDQISCARGSTRFFITSLTVWRWEKDFLARRNWTFRQNGRVPGIYRPYREPCSVGGPRKSGAVFRLFFPRCGRLNREARRMCGAAERALQVHTPTRLSRALVFRKLLSALTRIPLKDCSVSSVCKLWSLIRLNPEEDFKRILAEYLVITVESLPNYYVTAGLWNRYREDFVSAVATEELVRLRIAAEQAGRDLVNVSDELIASMKRIRSQLSLAFDVPFVAELSSARWSAPQPPFAATDSGYRHQHPPASDRIRVFTAR